MKPRPRLTQDNNPLNRRTVAGGDGLMSPAGMPPPTGEWVSYQIPPALRHRLQALQRQWQAQMPELTESQLVELALQFFLNQSQKIPPPLPPAEAEEDVMGYLD